MAPDTSGSALHGDDLLAATGRPRLLRPQTGLFVLVLLAWAGVFVYDHWFATGATFPFWDVRRLDWLFVAANVVLFFFVVLPALRNRDRTLDRLHQLRRNRGAAVAIAFLGGFYVLTLVGPTLLGRPDLHYPHKLQPPVFQAVPASAVTECVGPVVDGYCQGTWRYPLGSNGVGEGTIRLIIQAQRVAFLVALISAALIVPIAVGVGVTAATIGGRVDELLMRYVDVQQAIPAVLVYILLSFYYQQSLFMLVVVFGLLNWGGVARVVRSEVLSIADVGYVRAAKSAGAPSPHLIGRHVLPNISATLVTTVTREIPMLILIQVGLSYIGLNQPLLPSYGNLIGASFGNVGQPGVVYWWNSIPALLALAVTIASFSVLGDALRDVLDPRSDEGA